MIVEGVASALAQSADDVEVIVIDNASVDGTPELVWQHFGSRVEVISLPENTGYTGGYNRALRHARGEFVLLANPDMRLAPDYLEQALPLFADERVGIVAGRLMRPDETTVDSAGQFLSRSRTTLDRGYGRPLAPELERGGAVLAACGAAALYRRSMIDELTEDGCFFDEAYFAYHEDLELGWRAWRAGWRALYEPRAVAIHQRAEGKRHPLGLAFQRSPEVMAHILKNRYLSVLRHDRALAILVDLPFVLARELKVLGAITLLRPAVLKQLWRQRGLFRRALRQRGEDRVREGRWGRWRQSAPPRGVWKGEPAAIRESR